jgi:hypothetical protein
MYITGNVLFIRSGKSEMYREKWRGKSSKNVRTDTLFYSPGTKTKQAVGSEFEGVIVSIASFSKNWIAACLLVGRKFFYNMFLSKSGK